MASRERTETILWATTVVLGCTLVYHFVIGHRPGPEEPSTWPPPPDSAALLALRLPLATPLEVITDDLDTRVWSFIEGNIGLDDGGLEVALGYRSRLQVNPSFPWPISLHSTTLALAEPAATGWRIVEEGAPEVFPPAFRDAGAELPLPRAPLRLRGVGVLDLPGRWPVIIHTVRIEDPDLEEVVELRVFAHGDRDAFDDLLGRKPWDR